MKWLAAWMVALGLHSSQAGPPAQARTLEVELALQQVGGMLQPGEPESWLVLPDLTVEAVYMPQKLVEGKTARRIQTMPFGTRLEPISHTVLLRGAQIERVGRTLRFWLDEQAPTLAPYRLLSVYLKVPIAPGLGRPEPALQIGLLHEPATEGAHQAALTGQFDAIELGGRLRYRWSDAPANWQRGPTVCGGDAYEVDAERYRYRARHRHLGLFRALSSEVSSDAPLKPPVGWKSFQMREPYAAPITGWHVGRNHLIRLEVPGGRIDRLSVYAEHAGPGQCLRTRTYDALWSGEQFVRIERTVDESNCEQVDPPGQIARAEWLEDGRLVQYMAGSGAAPAVYDAFSIGQPAACGAAPATLPDAAQVNGLKAELNRLRETFLAR